MRRDPSVIVMGEDVAGAAGRAHLGLMDAWGGPMRATRGLIGEFGAGNRVRLVPMQAEVQNPQTEAAAAANKN